MFDDLSTRRVQGYLSGSSVTPSNGLVLAAMVAPVPSRVRLVVGSVGSSGGSATVLDLRKNGASMYHASASRPTIAAGANRQVFGGDAERHQFAAVRHAEPAGLDRGRARHARGDCRARGALDHDDGAATTAVSGHAAGVHSADDRWSTRTGRSGRSYGSGGSSRIAGTTRRGRSNRAAGQYRGTWFDWCVRSNRAAGRARLWWRGRSVWAAGHPGQHWRHRPSGNTGATGTVAAAGAGTALLPSISFAGDPNTGLYNSNPDEVSIATGGVQRWLVGTDLVEQRNGTNAQTSRVYNTYTDFANYERLNLLWFGNQAYVTSLSLGTGIPRDLNVGTQAASNLNLISNNTNRWQIPYCRSPLRGNR